MRAAAIFVLAVPSVLAVVFKPCTKDNLYSSLFEDGVTFCSSVLDSHCETVVTPTQFTMYKSSSIASQCECVLTERAIPGVSRTWSAPEPGSTTAPTLRIPSGPIQPSVTGNVSSVYTIGSSVISLNGTAAPTRNGWNSTIETSRAGTGTGFSGSVSFTIIPLPTSPASSGGNFTFPSLNGTAVSTATPTFLTPTGLNGTVSVPTINATGTIPTLPSVTFTRVAQSAYRREQSCYALPTSFPYWSTRRALLQNSKLSEVDAPIPYPYIESIEFDGQGLKPLWLTVRDSNEDTYMLDITNKSRIAVVDTNGNAMVICPEGIHFSTEDCNYDISFYVEDMYQQLAELSGQECSGRFTGFMEETEFTQTLYLSDQCGNPVTRDIRRYPRLKVGDTECVDTYCDEDSGRWEFDCTFPGSESSILQCQRSIQNDVIDFLFTDPFGGECPDLPSVITTLASALQLLVSKETLTEAILNSGITEDDRDDAIDVISSYLRLWRFLKQVFLVLGTDRKCALEKYIWVYEEYTQGRLESDICESLHSDEIPLKLSLTAGISYIDAITTFNWSPESPRSYNITIQDPSSIACCSPSFVSETSYGSCSYPADAYIGDSGCTCGRRVSGEGIAFERKECGNYVSECEADVDCADAGYGRYVCLTGSCCGGGVCVDPYACAQNGTGLVEDNMDWDI